MVHPMEPACVGYIPGSPEIQMSPYVGQGDLFRALKVELYYTDLISISLLMQ